MANVIDELVVLLSLDTTKFTQAQKDALASLKKTREETDKSDKAAVLSNKKVGESLRGVATEAAGLFAVLVGANSLKDFVVSTTQSISAISRAANLMGVGAHDLQVFRLVVAHTGNNADAASAQFLNFSKTVQGMRSGLVPLTKEMAFGLGQIGATLNTSPLETFEKFARWTVGKSGQQITQEAGFLGFGDDLASAAQIEGGNIGADIAAKQKEALSDQQIAQIKKMQGAFIDLQQAVTGSANAILSDAAPAITTFLSSLGSGKVNEFGRDVNTLGGDFKNIADDTKKLLGLIDPKVLGGITNFFVGFFEAFFNGIDHAFKSLDMLIRAATDFAKGDLKAAGADLKNYGKEWLAIWGLGPNATPSKYAWGFPTAASGASGDNGPPSSAAPSGSRAASLRAGLGTIGVTGSDADAALRGLNAEDPGFNPNTTNPTSGAHGIAQWLSADRKADFRAMFGHGVENSTFAEQQKFLLHELSGTARGRRTLAHMRAAGTLSGKVAAFIHDFEAPKPGAETAGDMARAGFPGGGAMYASNGGRGASGSSTSITIGEINVNAPGAKDAAGIAKSIHRALAAQLAAQSNSALN